MPVTEAWGSLHVSLERAMSPLPESPWSLRGVRLFLVGATAWLSPWACAPPATLPAPIPHGKAEGIELGGGLTASGAFSEDCRTTQRVELGTELVGEPSCERTLVVLPDAMHWGVVPLNDQWAVGWQLGGGMGTPGLTGGAMGRLDLAKSDRRLIGPQLELGFAWVALGIPMSLQVNDKVWIYTHPSVGLRINGMARAPVGLALDVGKRLRLDMEGGLTTPVSGGLYTRYDSVYSSRVWFGMGLSGRLGR